MGDVSLFEIPARPKFARCLLILWFDSGYLCLSCKFALKFVIFFVLSVQGGRGVPGPQGFGKKLAQNNKNVSGGTMVCTFNGKDPVDQCACGVWGGGLSPWTPPPFTSILSPRLHKRRPEGCRRKGWGNLIWGALKPHHRYAPTLFGTICGVKQSLTPFGFRGRASHSTIQLHDPW